LFLVNDVDLGNRQWTIDVGSNVATQITSTLPVVAERSQYWSAVGGALNESHNSLGVTASATKWGLAEGRAGGPEGYQTYILLANAGTSPANVTLRFLGDGSGGAGRADRDGRRAAAAVRCASILAIPRGMLRRRLGRSSRRTIRSSSSARCTGIRRVSCGARARTRGGQVCRK
jgi:hypothetical protein